MHSNPYWLNSDMHLNKCQTVILQWGVVCEGVSVDRLQEAEVEIINTSTCNRADWYNGVISDNMICAGSETGAVDTCQVTPSSNQ